MGAWDSVREFYNILGNRGFGFIQRDRHWCFVLFLFWIWPPGGGRLGGGGIQEVVNADLRPSGAAVLGT